MMSILLKAQSNPLRINYAFNDSLKVTSFYCEVTIPKNSNSNRVNYTPCGFDKGFFGLAKFGPKTITFSANARDEEGTTSKAGDKTRLFAMGQNIHLTITRKPTAARWLHHWVADSTYRFLITALPDSSFTYYTAYVFEPQKKKWKMLAAFERSSDGKYLQGLYSAISNDNFPFTDENSNINNLNAIKNPWIQTEDKQWYSLATTNRPDTSLHPFVDLYKNFDSATQAIKETKTIQAAIAKGTLHKMNYKSGIYYEILKEGPGRNVLLSDTVVAFYKGSILNGETFDQTEKEPATFPLNRLIKGWQIGVPWCKIGGKIRLVLPSALAYSIRTRSPKIPPNSILVFDIEVVGVK